MFLGVAARKHNGAAAICVISARNSAMVQTQLFCDRSVSSASCLQLLCFSVSVLCFSTCSAADELFFSSLHYDKSGHAHNTRWIQRAAHYEI